VASIRRKRIQTYRLENRRKSNPSKQQANPGTSRFSPSFFFFLLSFPLILRLLLASAANCAIRALQNCSLPRTRGASSRAIFPAPSFSSLRMNLVSLFIFLYLFNLVLSPPFLTYFIFFHSFDPLFTRL
jgi:hypothetical protein